MKSFDVTSMFGTTECTLSKHTYADNNHIALQLWCDEGPYATLTVNLRETKKHPNNYGFVDINNFPDGEALIKKLKIGKKVAGIYGHSGFCSYPLYAFDVEAIKKWTEEV